MEEVDTYMQKCDGCGISAEEAGTLMACSCFLKAYHSTECFDKDQIAHKLDCDEFCELIAGPRAILDRARGKSNYAAILSDYAGALGRYADSIVGGENPFEARHDLENMVPRFVDEVKSKTRKPSMKTAIEALNSKMTAAINKMSQEKPGEANQEVAEAEQHVTAALFDIWKEENKFSVRQKATAISHAWQTYMAALRTAVLSVPKVGGDTDRMKSQFTNAKLMGTRAGVVIGGGAKLK